MTDFEKELEIKAEEVCKLIEPFLPEEEGEQKRVIESMRYSFLSGGKRLRPMFMKESFEFFGGKDITLIAPFMAAIEMIHTYSLIHDDLPAMDDDDYRRGRLTNHKMFDEATAILAGDGLLNYAFETVAKSMSDEKDPEVLQRKAKAFAILSKKAGIYGMIGGQMADIEGEKNKDADLETLLFIHENKTAALIEASLTIGAVMAGASFEEVSKMEKTASNVGIAFQIQDDILDIIGDAAALGKSIGSDVKNEKVTYVTLKGIEESVKEVKRLSDEANALLSEMSDEETFLNKLINYLITRDK